MPWTKVSSHYTLIQRLQSLDRKEFELFVKKIKKKLQLKYRNCFDIHVSQKRKNMRYVHATVRAWFEHPCCMQTQLDYGVKIRQFNFGLSDYLNVDLYK